jgi:hypothetical protein
MYHGFEKSNCHMAMHPHEFIKLITKIEVSCPNLNIHKSKEVIVVTHESKVGITYCFMVLATNEEMAC